MEYKFQKRNIKKIKEYTRLIPSILFNPSFIHL
nr:MAG TPA: hypothetical protein [Caudoviricetes sp.]